jgi:methyl-accepting chemotaxis protein
MYSFRFNEDLMKDAKKAARNMGVSLSFFVSYLIKEKINNLNSGSEGVGLFNGDDTIKILNKIALEIEGLRVDLNKMIKNK